MKMFYVGHFLIYNKHVYDDVIKETMIFATDEKRIMLKAEQT